MLNVFREQKFKSKQFSFAKCEWKHDFDTNHGHHQLRKTYDKVAHSKYITR